MHRGYQSGGASGGVQQHCKLLGNSGVRNARCRDHVQDTLPDLVEAIESAAAAALEQLAKPRGGGIEDQRSHDQSVTGAGLSPPVGKRLWWGLGRTGYVVNFCPGERHWRWR